MNAQTHYLEDENNKLKERIDELGLILHSRNEQYREHRAKIKKLEAENQRLTKAIAEIFKLVDTGDVTEPWIRQKIYSIIRELEE